MRIGRASKHRCCVGSCICRKTQRDGTDKHTGTQSEGAGRAAHHAALCQEGPTNAEQSSLTHRRYQCRPACCEAAAASPLAAAIRLCCAGSSSALLQRLVAAAGPPPPQSNRGCGRCRRRRRRHHPSLSPAGAVGSWCSSAGLRRSLRAAGTWLRAVKLLQTQVPRHFTWAAGHRLCGQATALCAEDGAFLGQECS